MNEEINDRIEKFEKKKNYWLDKLSGLSNVDLLTPDFPRTPFYQQERCILSFDKRLENHIFQITQGNPLSLYVILLASFKVLMLRYSSQNDIIVASPMHMKDPYDYNKFLPIRDMLEPEMTFINILMAVKETVQDAYQNQHYPLREIFKHFGLNDKETKSFGNTLLSLENIHKNSDRIANDMTLSFSSTDKKLEGSILYNAALFRIDTIERLVRLYIRTLEWGLSHLNAPVIEMDLITGAEKEKLLYEFNDTKINYPEALTLHELFEAQVEKTPDHIALAMNETQLTYQELNQRANQLAWVLREKGLKPDDRVGIMAERSPEVIVGILGILKAGGAYLPIDPQYPEQRKQYMLENADVSILLTRTHLTGKIHFERDIIDIDDEMIYTGKKGNLGKTSSPHHLAYIIYTSGSTGNPKGVMIEHRNIVNFAYWRIQAYQFTSQDITLQLISVAFDGFCANLYSALLSGGVLLLIDEDQTLNNEHIQSEIKNRGVTNFSVVPSMYSMILENAAPDILDRVRFVVLAGEKANSDLLELSKSMNPNTKLINEYGPTENSVTTAANFGLTSESTRIIGKPIYNNAVFVLDAHEKLLPLGVPGELCVSGKSLGRGYLHQPELTKQKFVDHPFIPGEKMYKTGDRVRWLPDGTIEFLGRVDHQIKIRGFRVELEEIENHLKRIPEIKEAAVIDRNGGNGQKHLYAYMVSDYALNFSAIKTTMVEMVPAYMVPTYFIQLEDMPLTPTGKMDRRQLPDPKVSSSRFLSQYAFEIEDIPETQEEKMLADIWKEVLKIDHVGVNDNFFDAGGTSLNIVRVKTCLREKYGIDVAMASLFKYQTLGDFAKHLNEVQLIDSQDNMITRGVS